MFFLDASPCDVVKRVKKRTEKEMFENYKELNKVRKIALSLAKDWYIVDTSKSIEEVSNFIDKIVNELDNKII
jgi:thymidylate kinase